VVRQTAANRESGWHRMGFESPALRAVPSFGRAERRVGRLTLRYPQGRLSAACDLASRFTRLDPPSRRVVSFPRSNGRTRASVTCITERARKGSVRPLPRLRVGCARSFDGGSPASRRLRVHTSCGTRSARSGNNRKMATRAGLLFITVGLLLGVAASGLAAAGSALSAFHTPGWAAQCFVVGEESPTILSCETRSGAIASMRTTGRASVSETTHRYRQEPQRPRLVARLHWRPSSRLRHWQPTHRAARFRA